MRRFALIAILLAAVILGYFTFSSVLVKWPKVSSPEKLISDCEQLLSNYAEGENVPIDELPASIAEIDPQYVYVEDGFIKIIISSGGIGDSWGLIVVGSDNQDIVPTYANETSTSRIYRFK